MKHKKDDLTLDQLMHRFHIKEKTRTCDKEEDVKNQQSKPLLFKEKLHIRSPRTISQKGMPWKPSVPTTPNTLASILELRSRMLLMS